MRLFHSNSSAMAFLKLATFFKKYRPGKSTQLDEYEKINMRHTFAAVTSRNLRETIGTIMTSAAKARSNEEVLLTILSLNALLFKLLGGVMTDAELLLLCLIFATVTIMYANRTTARRTMPGKAVVQK